jgi:hypothetical protein
VRPWNGQGKNALVLGKVEEDLGAASRRGRAMSADRIGRSTNTRIGEQANEPAEAHGKSSRTEDIVGYGDEAAWTSVVWVVVGILCACGLAALLFVQ